MTTNKKSLQEALQQIESKLEEAYNIADKYEDIHFFALLGESYVEGETNTHRKHIVTTNFLNLSFMLALAAKEDSGTFRAMKTAIKAVEKCETNKHN